MILLTLSKSLSIASPYFLKITVNALAEASKMDFNLAVLGILGFGASRLFSSVFQEIRMNQIAQVIQLGIEKTSVKCFTHLHALDIYFHKISSKNTVFAINKALRSIESALRFTLGFFTPVAFEFVLLCGMLQFYCGAPYLLNMLVTLSLYTVFSKQYSAYRQQIIRKRKNQEKASEFYLNESIMNYETVKAFNKEKFELTRYQALLEKLKGTAMQVQTTLSKLNVGQSLIFSTGLTINLVLAAWDVSNGRLTPGDFVMIQALFMQLAGPLFNMGTLFREIDQSQVDVEDLFFMLKQQPVIKEKEGAVAYEYRGGEIELRNVSFKHLLTDSKNGEVSSSKKNEYMFENLSLKIKPGTSNAIVGHSGFGKTTMINMITRLYDPSAGSVLLDGQDLKDLSFESYRKHIAVIPQNGILFNDTVLFNLSYGNPGATLEEIQEVAKKCQIHDRILQMEEGYNTKVGDLGGKLSGGERQRILIARALLKKDARIFLFDEATSNLDAHTERDITDELDEMLTSKTVIYCAHRLSSIVNVDNIFVLADGKVAEQGTHWDLIENEGSLYADMWRKYLREKEAEKTN